MSSASTPSSSTARSGKPATNSEAGQRWKALSRGPGNTPPTEALTSRVEAAVLAQGIAEGQPFIEGNKRTALASLRAFLLANGFQVTATQTERANWMMRLSEGASPDDLAGWIRGALVRDGGAEE